MPPKGKKCIKLIDKIKKNHQEKPDDKPTRSNDAPHGFVGFLWFSEIFGYVLHFSHRNHRTNEHITLSLDAVIPRVLDYLEMTDGQTHNKGPLYFLWVFIDTLIIIWRVCPKWEWCIIIWWWCVVVPICLIIQESGLQPVIVDGCVVLYKAGGHWWIRTVDGQPDIKLPGRYGTIEELFGLDQQETAEVRGEDRPSRDDDNATKRQEEEEGEEERVQRARDKVANSHIDKDTYAPFINGLLDDGPLLPGQWSEEVLSVGWLLSDPSRGLGLLPALFGVAGSDGKVPQGWDFSNAQLNHVLETFEKESPCPPRGNEGETSFVERRLRNAARYCTDRNTLGHLRLSDTFRRLQVEAKPNTRAAARRGGSN
ncbi:unnamed protein product [Vitrella brassicaformis CCMP3155]|uniref:Uncharacterized protein n=1 Tax=Vitrella brassicaformis (strain CCMP3155) TaxID=1169540 RepID=A0A0G4H4I2_VITBC|nr:unnamed protein product [Vitrella brassicaformis CCMP3155]|eukprot:CEM38565.1 unnamed protein product [Vitrella brassicaformis CCMP3155]